MSRKVTYHCQTMLFKIYFLDNCLTDAFQHISFISVLINELAPQENQKCAFSFPGNDV